MTDQKPLRVAAQAMIDKLEAISADPSYIGILASASAHGVRYTGPTYTQELLDLIAALESK